MKTKLLTSGRECLTVMYMAEVLGALLMVYMIGLFVAMGNGKWPAEDIALWPLTLLLKWWRRHMRDGE